MQSIWHRQGPVCQPKWRVGSGVGGAAASVIDQDQQKRASRLQGLQGRAGVGGWGQHIIGGFESGPIKCARRGVKGAG